MDGRSRASSRILALTAVMALILASATVARAEDFEAPPPPGNFHWKVYDYNASGQALRSRQPFIVSTPDGGIAFDFLDRPDTALLITGHPSYRGDLLGDISMKTTISARVGVTVSALTDFDYYGEPDACDPAGTNGANVRFFFQTQTTGPFNPMDYWWANSATSHVQLKNLKDLGDFTITNTFAPNEWSDWDGHVATSDAAHLAAFDAAKHNVKAMGLSFGGGCFFENGVGIHPGTGSGFFRLHDFSTSPSSPLDIDTAIVPTLLLAPFVTPTLIELP